jgi:hypothetical protein
LVRIICEGLTKNYDEQKRGSLFKVLLFPYLLGGMQEDGEKKISQDNTPVDRDLKPRITAHESYNNC